MIKKIAILLLLLVVGIIWIVNNYNKPTNNESTPKETTELPGMQIGTLPWIAERENLNKRLEQIGLPALSEEGVVLHTHQHLDLYIEGKKIDIPPEIGINENEGFISPIHTHDLTGIIHVESPTVQDFTLGQFMDIWGVKFTDECIGGYCGQLQVFSNGTKLSNNFRDLKLEAHLEIVIIFRQAPEIIPSSFAFPAGY